MSKLESTDGRTVDFLLSDAVPSTSAENDVRILPYSKLPDIEGNLRFYCEIKLLVAYKMCKDANRHRQIWHSMSPFIFM